MFKDIDKTLEQAKRRWTKIEELADVVKNPSDHNIKINHPEYTQKMAMLLIALVDYMRPMNPTEEKIGEATKGIEDLLRKIQQNQK